MNTKLELKINSKYDSLHQDLSHLLWDAHPATNRWIGFSHDPNTAYIIHLQQVIDGLKKITGDFESLERWVQEVGESENSSSDEADILM